MPSKNRFVSIGLQIFLHFRHCFQLDAELTRFEKLSDEDIERMRAQRLEAMKQDHKKRQDWLANGKISR